MNIYRERIWAYLVIGFIAAGLGFFPPNFATGIVQPAVGIWITSSVIMLFWASATKGFRDPMKSIFGIPMNVVGLGLTVLGVVLIVYGFSDTSMRTGEAGVLMLCFALDANLSKRESERRYEAHTEKQS